jgi:hypothetical protein
MMPLKEAGSNGRRKDRKDRTCRNPMCRRRATQCDLDHAIPYDQGGRSWTTPAGLTYRKEPHRYAI